MAEPDLQKGSTDPSVRDLQGALKALDYYLGAIDGVFGTTTEAAVKAFQQAKGIPIVALSGSNGSRPASSRHLAQALHFARPSG